MLVALEFSMSSGTSKTSPWRRGHHTTRQETPQELDHIGWLQGSASGQPGLLKCYQPWGPTH
eukprot:6488760-Amphidinium_carterae.2